MRRRLASACYALGLVLGPVGVGAEDELAREPRRPGRRARPRRYSFGWRGGSLLAILENGRRVVTALQPWIT